MNPIELTMGVNNKTKDDKARQDTARQGRARLGLGLGLVFYIRIELGVRV